MLAVMRGSQELHEAITLRRDSTVTDVAWTLVVGHPIVAAKRFVYILKSLKTPAPYLRVADTLANCHA